MEEDYQIIESELGRNKHSKVYLLEGNITRLKLIVKIYESSQAKFLKNEKSILKDLNEILSVQENNNFFIMYKEIQYNPNMFNIPEEVIGNNLEFLFYDYLPKLSLLHYIIGYKEKIKEIHAKYIAYKILKSLDQMHLINICHNSLKSYNIMFDDDFNLKFIHFCRAKQINDQNEGNKLNKDIFDLGQILAQIISQGKYKSIGYHKKTNSYVIFTFSKKNGKYEHIEEYKFWKSLTANYNIYVSQEFLSFFRVLIYLKRSKDMANIEPLLGNGWLKEIINDIPKYKDIFINDFNNLYNNINEDKDKLNEITIDIDNLINEYDDESYTEPIKESEIPKEYFDIYNKENIKVDSYEQNLNKINNGLNKINIKDENLSKPKKDKFNYLEINIINKNNEDIIKAINDFMENLKNNLSEFYDEAEIKVNFKEEKDFSFKIKYEIPPMNISDDEIEFFDEKFQRKVRDFQKFEIKVELIEGDKNLIETKKIHQYYLIFNGDSLDKEDFYDHLEILKVNAKNSLFNN